MRTIRADLYGEPKYPTDVAQLKEEIPDLEDVPDSFVSHYWEEFSCAEASSGWLRVTDVHVERFQEWLFDEVGVGDGDEVDETDEDAVPQYCLAKRLIPNT